MYPSRTAPRWLGLGASLLIAAVALVFSSLSQGHHALPDSDWDHVSDLAHSRDNLLRLHVLAHSDAPQDQMAKLQVRDAVLKEMAKWQRPEDPAQLEQWVSERQGALIDAASRVLRELGHERQVRVETGAFSFPAIEWRDGILPAGEYRAIRIIIGDGAGANWWCVLFPPLCFVEETSESNGGSVAHAHEAGLGSGYGSGEKAIEGVPGEPVEPGELHDGKPAVSWRLRLWESIGRSAVAGRVKELVGASWEFARKIGME